MAVVADNDTLMMAEGFICALGLDVDASEPDVSPLAIQGPKSHYVARDLLGDTPLRLSYFGFYETELQGIPLVVAFDQGGANRAVMNSICVMAPKVASSGILLWKRENHTR